MNNDLNSCDPQELIIRESFKKDYKLSCPVIDDNDVFNKSIMIAELQQEWINYKDMVDRIEGNLDNYRKQIRHTVTNHLSHVKGFDKLTPEKNTNKYTNKYTGPRTCLRDEVCGKKLISIDLIKANYQSMRHLNPKFVLDTQNYQELITKFTQEKCMIECRMLRQLIFGFLKPEVQVAVQKTIIGTVIDQIIKECGDETLLIEQLTNDEVVFSINSNEKDYTKILNKINDMITKLPYQLRLTEFSVEKIKNSFNEPWFIKKFNDDRYKIVGVHVRYLFQVYNHLHQLENEKKDLWWRERGRLCALLDQEEFI